MSRTSELRKRVLKFVPIEDLSRLLEMPDGSPLTIYPNDNKSRALTEYINRRRYRRTGNKNGFEQYCEESGVILAHRPPYENNDRVYQITSDEGMSVYESAVWAARLGRRVSIYPDIPISHLLATYVKLRVPDARVRVAKKRGNYQDVYSIDTLSDVLKGQITRHELVGKIGELPAD